MMYFFCSRPYESGYDISAKLRRSSSSSNMMFLIFFKTSSCRFPKFSATVKESVTTALPLISTNSFDIYASSCWANARFKSSGVASFHWTTVFPGKSSASFIAHGHDTARLPESVRETMAGLSPYLLQICFCLIFMALIYGNYFHLSTLFFKMKIIIQASENT